MNAAQGRTTSELKRSSPRAQGLRDIAEQVASLTNGEHKRLADIVQRLVALDEELADVHLCLPTVEIVFYLFDRASDESVSLTTWDLQALLAATTSPRAVPR